ncbi:CDP-glycerol glycerophosphotransferase family protein [Microbulbifer sp. ZKSA002]|uniref:CDP-glycerol glycerophosphotransferase family protein n=1 Tax=Microbulbifer sp. ZKSA002 TaxID=3243388 RepID=UPI00403977CF
MKYYKFRSLLKSVLSSAGLLPLARKVYGKTLVQKIISIVFNNEIKYPQDLYVKLRQSEAIEENTILYESFHGSSIGCSPYGIFKVLSNESGCQGFKHVFAIKPSVKIPRNLANLNKVSFVRIGSKKYISLLAKAKYLVNNSTFPTYFNRRSEQVYINTWHGVPLKKMFMDESKKVTLHRNSAKNFLHSTHLLLPNKYTAEKLLRSSGLEGIVSAQIHLGVPARQCLASLANVDELRRYLGISGEKKVIFYAPTWRGELGAGRAQSSEIGQVVEALLNEPSNHVILSVHNMASADIQLSPRLSILDGRVDSNEVLALCDVLITDYSSIMFDAANLGVKTLLYVYDRAEYLSTRGCYLNFDDLPFPCCHSIDELVEALNQNLDQEGENYPGPSELEAFSLEGSLKCTKELILDIFLEGNTIKGNYSALNRRKNIVVYLGGLRPNGISTSAINLTRNFDYSKYNLIILTSGAFIDKSDAARDIVRKFDTRAHVLHQAGPIAFTDEEKFAWGKFQSNNLLDEEAERILRACFQREAERFLGGVCCDVAVDFSGYSPYWSLLMGSILAKRRVIYQHNDLLSEANIRYRSLFGVFASYRLFDRILSVSKETMELNKSSLEPLYEGLVEKFDFIPNFIVPEEIREAAKKGSSFQLDDERVFFACNSDSLGDRERRAALDGVSINKALPVVFTMGRLSGEKDHKKLLHAVAQLAKDGVQIQLFIAGEGPLREELLVLRDTLGLENYVFFIGQLSNPFPLLNRADIFVLPSNYEGQPMVLLEALTLSKQIVATNIAGNRSVLGDHYGTLVENTISGVASGIKDALAGKSSFVNFDAASYVRKTSDEFEKKVLGAY